MAGVRRQQRSVSDVFKQNLKTGAIVGAGAYVVGFVLTVVFTAIDGLESSVVEAEGWKAVGWVFYGAHNVQITSTQTIGSRSGSQSVSIFEMATNGFATSRSGLTSTIPELVYMLLPVVVLIGAGYLAYEQSGARITETDRVAALGATVAAGYLALSVLGTFIFEYSRSTTQTGFSGEQVSASFSAGPELTTAVILMGLLYPLVLGAIGALLAQKRNGGQNAAGHPGV